MDRSRQTKPVSEPVLSVSPFLGPCLSPSQETASPGRLLVQAFVLLLCTIVLFRALIAEPFRVPTGSMAPGLLGDHKLVCCPRCGYPVVVGRHYHKEEQAEGHYPAARCPNCGCSDLELDNVPECDGDRLLVNKSIFDLRRPRRWEMVVFQCPFDPAKIFVKRIAGLPGESVQIRGGDVYVDGLIARKTLKEFKALRIPVFDNNYQPWPGGWNVRWQAEPADGSTGLTQTVLHLNGADHKNERWLIYRHWDLDQNGEQAIYDTYGYSGADQGQRREPVHDFMLECDLDIRRGNGWVGFGISDGLDSLVAEIAVGAAAGATKLKHAGGQLCAASSFHLEAGSGYHIELAFVDRRATLSVNGFCPFEPVDFPAAFKRSEVCRPIRIGVNGVDAALRNVRLFRDIHYTASGQHGIDEAVHLGPGQYFVLGDNSPNSDDSRFWRNPAVPEANFLGKPFLVHWSTRIMTWNGFGRHWEYRWLDWDRVRWLR